MKIVAVTACVTGLAHCKMSRKALLKEAEKEGIELTCEAQTSSGIEHRLDQADIDSADVVIHAVDVSVREKSRFDGKIIYKTSPSYVLRGPDKIIAEAIKLIK